MFIDIAEGQMHCRLTSSETAPNRRPILLLHASPVSSLLMDRMARLFAPTRAVIAFDTLGQGDSSPPRSLEEPIGYFADAALRALAVLGEEFSRTDVFGTHTGGRIAAEMAIAAPDVVCSVVMDGMRRMPREHYDAYTPRVDLSQHVDHHGTQFYKAWNKWRDEYLFVPPFQWSLEHLSGAPLPTPSEMHHAAVEVFKGIPFGHVAYRAAISYCIEDRLPLIQQPALATCARHDGGFADLDFVAGLLLNGNAIEHEHRVEYATDPDLAAFVQRLVNWIDRRQPSDEAI